MAPEIRRLDLDKSGKPDRLGTATRWSCLNGKRS
jgi:hypothetical protein